MQRSRDCGGKHIDTSWPPLKRLVGRRRRQWDVVGSLYSSFQACVHLWVHLALLACSINECQLSQSSYKRFAALLSHLNRFKQRHILVLSRYCICADSKHMWTQTSMAYLDRRNWQQKQVTRNQCTFMKKHLTSQTLNIYNLLLYDCRYVNNCSLSL